MSTQLRLVETPTTPRAGRARATTRGRAARQAHWDVDWGLDARARRVGRRGVAAARAALERARPELAEAS